MTQWWLRQFAVLFHLEKSTDPVLRIRFDVCQHGVQPLPLELEKETRKQWLRI
jgi:hypothetical protein